MIDGHIVFLIYNRNTDEGELCGKTYAWETFTSTGKDPVTYTANSWTQVRNGDEVWTSIISGSVTSVVIASTDETTVTSETMNANVAAWMGIR